MRPMAEESIPTEKLSHRLTGQDASFIYGESRNGPLHIGSLSFFEDQITYPELIRHFESKLHLLPRYRQRLLPVPFNLNHATFEDDPDFKIENHVKFHQLPADTSEVQLIEAGLAVFRKPLDRTRPLWEVHLFNGLKGNRSVISDTSSGAAATDDRRHARPRAGAGRLDAPPESSGFELSVVR